MAGANFLDHNLVSVDPSILSYWEEKVKEGFDCTLLLKHSKGKVTTILKCSKLVASSDARNSVPQPAVPPTQAEVAKRKKRRKMSKKKLQSLTRSAWRKKRACPRAGSCFSTQLLCHPYLQVRSSSVTNGVFFNFQASTKVASTKSLRSLRLCVKWNRTSL